MTKLIQLKLSDLKLTKYDKLVNILGYKGTFGEYQKAIDFSIDYTLSGLEREAVVLPDLDEVKMALFLSSIQRVLKTKKMANDRIKTLQKP